MTLEGAVLHRVGRRWRYRHLETGRSVGRITQGIYLWSLPHINFFFSQIATLGKLHKQIQQQMLYILSAQF